MAGAEKIKEKILEEARLQARSIIEGAEKEAAEIIHAARSEADAKNAEVMNKAKDKAAETLRRLISVQELEARKQKLQAKQELVDEAFAKALENLNSLPENQYQEILVNMVVNSVSNGNEEIILSDRDKQRLNTGFADAVNSKLKEMGINGNVKISDITRNMNGGFILKSGDIETNNTFEAVIRMMRDGLEAEVVKTLFS